VCDTQIIAVRASGDDLDIRCGGVAMSAQADDPRVEMVGGFDGGTAMGKRYSDADDVLEVLCTKPGQGALSIGDTLLTVREAKPLPASD
jgi:hypothetical protein